LSSTSVRILIADHDNSNDHNAINTLKNEGFTTNITMKELGDKVGISQAQISQIEAGQSAPSLTTLFRISRVLEIRLTDLFVNSR